MRKFRNNVIYETSPRVLARNRPKKKKKFMAIAREFSTATAQEMSLKTAS
jgi:hypothetical protein